MRRRAAPSVEEAGNGRPSARRAATHGGPRKQGLGQDLASAGGTNPITESYIDLCSKRNLVSEESGLNSSYIYLRTFQS